MNIPKLAASILICEFAGILGSVFTYPSVTTWYASIVKPSFNPPNWIFAPVWTALFFLMGISLYIVWNEGLKDKGIKIPVYVFGIQLILNVIWSLLFFGLQNPFFAFLEIILLWFSILATIMLFYKISGKAAYLLIPYILWVSFAAFLNYNIWILNL